MRDAGTFAEQPTGRLRLNVPQMVYPHFLKPVVASFLKKYPDVTVELCFQNAATDIFERGFDAGIRVSDILAKDMVALRLFGPLRYVVVGSPKYLDKVGRPEHPRDLLSQNCIRVGVGDRIYDRWEFESERKAFEVQVKGSLIMNDSLLAMGAALDDLGLIYSTEDAIINNVEAGDLEIVLGQYAPTSTGWFLYFPQRSQVHPKLRAFIEHVKQHQRVK